MGEPFGANGRRLVLLVDNDVESRRQTRRVLELRGLEVVQASNGIAALELVQRLPNSFSLVLTELDLPGVPGPVLIETLRLFRPELPLLCMSAQRAASGAAVKGCLAKPIQSDDLEAALEERGDTWSPPPTEISEAAAEKAKARYAAVGDLVEAALELARGATPGG